MQPFPPPTLSKPLSFTLGDWDDKACVRTKKRHLMRPTRREMTLENRNWFPPAFMSYLEHPLIIDTDKNFKKILTANHLIHFLDYTTALEHRIVNKAIETIIYSELDIEIPNPMKIAALQLYTDEGYHALFSHEMAEQVANLYNIHNRNHTPHRINLILNLANNSNPNHGKLTWFLIGFVSETIIAKDLANITCRDLVPSVYEMLRQHLQDEARHSQYFTNAFQYIWRNLNIEQKRFSASLLREAIFIFSEIDSTWLMSSLCSVGFSKPQASEIAESIMTPSAVIQRARSSAAHTILTMKKSGVFENEENKLLFKKSGIIDD